MKRIKQVTESKNLITQALLDLLKEKELDDISLVEIANKAQVTRMTLHRHFKDKSDILIYYLNCNQVILENSIQPSASLYDLIYAQLHLIKLNPNRELLIKYNELHKLQGEIELDIPPGYEHLIPLDPTSYEYIFLVKGLNAIVSKWIKNGLTESPEEMASLIYQLISKITAT